MTDFPVPQGVPTSVTLPELRLLQKYAAGRQVLEIGTHLGFTCVGMALAGADVVAVDPHTDDPGTWDAFLNNARSHGYEPTLPASWHKGGDGAILAIALPIEDAYLAHVSFDLVFIDGDHIAPAPLRDAEIAMQYLREPGFIAYHDVTPAWPDVWDATRYLCAAGRMVRLEQVGTMVVYQVRR